MGKNINSSQFQFDPGDLAYIAGNYIPLDHQQLFSLSAGASYSWDKTHLSADLLYGTGLRKDGATPNGDRVPDYVTVNFGISQDFDVGGVKGLTARFDILNAFDEIYDHPRRHRHRRGRAAVRRPARILLRIVEGDFSRTGRVFVPETRASCSSSLRFSGSPPP